MDNTRTSHSADDKMQIVLDILSKKTNIQKVARARGIAPTLISLWKKQGLEAMKARFEPQPKGRKKSVCEPSAPKGDVRAARKDARAAKIRAAHLENSLREARARLQAMEEQVQAMAAALGCSLVKNRKPRKSRKA